MDFSFIVPEKYSGLMMSSRRHHLFSSFYALSKQGASRRTSTPWMEQMEQYAGVARHLASRGDLLILEAGFSSYLPAGVDRIEALERMIYDLRDGCLVIVLPFEDPHANVTWLDTGIGPVSGSTGAMVLLKGDDLKTVTSPLSELSGYFSETGITWVGLAKELETISEGNIGGRARVLDVYASELKPYNLWLAGMYRDPIVEMRLAREAAATHDLQIRGADSTKLWRLCSQGRTFTEVSPYPDPFDFRQVDVPVAFLEFIEFQFESFRRQIVT